MTRYARAVGSKSSNARVSADPTPWSEMVKATTKRPASGIEDDDVTTPPKKEKKTPAKKTPKVVQLPQTPKSPIVSPAAAVSEKKAIRKTPMRPKTSTVSTPANLDTPSAGKMSEPSPLQTRSARRKKAELNATLGTPVAKPVTPAPKGKGLKGNTPGNTSKVQTPASRKGKAKSQDVDEIRLKLEDSDDLDSDDENECVDSDDDAEPSDGLNNSLDAETREKLKQELAAITSKPSNRKSILKKADSSVVVKSETPAKKKAKSPTKITEAKAKSPSVVPAAEKLLTEQNSEKTGTPKAVDVTPGKPGTEQKVKKEPGVDVTTPGKKLGLTPKGTPPVTTAEVKDSASKAETPRSSGVTPKGKAARNSVTPKGMKAVDFFAGTPASTKTPEEPQVAVKTEADPVAPVNTPNNKNAQTGGQTPGKKSPKVAKTPDKDDASNKAAVKTPASNKKPAKEELAAASTENSQVAPAAPVNKESPAPKKTPAKKAAAAAKTPAKDPAVGAKTPAKENVASAKTPAKENVTAAAKTPAKESDVAVKTPAKKTGVKTPKKAAAKSPAEKSPAVSKTPVKVDSTGSNETGAAPEGEEAKMSRSAKKAAKRKAKKRDSAAMASTETPGNDGPPSAKKAAREATDPSASNPVAEDKVPMKEIQSNDADSTAVVSKKKRKAKKKKGSAQENTVAASNTAPETTATEKAKEEGNAVTVPPQKKKKKAQKNKAKPSVGADAVQEGKENTLNEKPADGDAVPVQQNKRKFTEEHLASVRKNMEADGKTDEEIAAHLSSLRGTKRVRCLRCRMMGHMQMDCPQKKTKSPRKCYKCGDSTHMSRDCSIKEAVHTFAECFVCRETGHITKDCPRNTNGIYPRGGACFKCGDKTHLSKNCTKRKIQQDENEEPKKKSALIGVLDSKQSADADVELSTAKSAVAIKKSKKQVVKF